MRHVWMLCLILGCFSVNSAFGHALWVETSGRGEVGKKQEVRIYFGEYSTQDITPTADWMSDLSEFSLVLITPDQREIPLVYNPEKMYFTASFTPDQAGAYQIALHHVAKDLYHGYRLDYNATAIVQVGAEPTVPTQANSIGIIPKTVQFTVNEPIDFTVFSNPEWAGGKEVEVIAPNTWIKKVYPNEAGGGSFVPLWPGKYLIELIVKSDTEDLHHGQKVTTDFHCATYLVEVP